MLFTQIEQFAVLWMSSFLRFLPALKKRKEKLDLIEYSTFGILRLLIAHTHSQRNPPPHVDVDIFWEIDPTISKINPFTQKKSTMVANINKIRNTNQAPKKLIIVIIVLRRGSIFFIKKIR